jgi:hypothetical protein
MVSLSAILLLCQVGRRATLSAKETCREALTVVPLDTLGGATWSKTAQLFGLINCACAGIWSPDQAVVNWDWSRKPASTAVTVAER